jgi:hypothetical protein
MIGSCDGLRTEHAMCGSARDPIGGGDHGRSSSINPAPASVFFTEIFRTIEKFWLWQVSGFPRALPVPNQVIMEIGQHAGQPMTFSIQIF